MSATGNYCTDSGLHADYTVEVLSRVLTGQQSNRLTSSLATAEDPPQHIILLIGKG